MHLDILMVFQFIANTSLLKLKLYLVKLLIDQSFPMLPV